MYTTVQKFGDCNLSKNSLFQSKWSSYSYICTVTHSPSSSSLSCRTQHSHLMWKTWPRRSGLYWWPRLRWRSTRETPRCWWTCSTVWPNLTPAHLNSARRGWTAWPGSTWRMETSLRYNTHTSSCMSNILWSSCSLIWFFSGSHVLCACGSAGGRIPEEERLDTHMLL